MNNIANISSTEITPLLIEWTLTSLRERTISEGKDATTEVGLKLSSFLTLSRCYEERQWRAFVVNREGGESDTQ